MNKIKELLEGVKIETSPCVEKEKMYLDIMIQNVPYFFLYSYELGEDCDLDTILKVTRGDLTRSNYDLFMERIEKILPSKFHDWEYSVVEHVYPDNKSMLRVDLRLVKCEVD